MPLQYCIDMHCEVLKLPLNQFSSRYGNSRCNETTK